MKLSTATEYLEDVSKTNSRIEKQDFVWKALSEADSQSDEDTLLALTTCQRFSDIGVAKKTVRKAGRKVVDGGEDRIKTLESDEGDLPSAIGKASEHTERLTPRTDIPLSQLWADLIEIEQTSGDKKLQKIITRMLSDYKHPKWVAHAVLADDGVSMGFGVKSAAKMIRRNYPSISKDDMMKARALCPDIIQLNREAPDVPLEPRVGEPFKPMLASSKGMPDVEVRDWMVQPKYDGARIIVHYDNGAWCAFSRRVNEVTDSLPELESYLEPVSDDLSFIIDGEAVAYQNGEPQDFRHIMTRFNREKNIEEQDIEVRFHWFDCLYADHPKDESLNGDLSDRPNLFRAKTALRSIFSHLNRDAQWIAPCTSVGSKNQAKKIHQHYVQQGYEGVIIKREDAPYEYDKRSQDWRKVKKDTENVDLRVSEIIEGEDDRAGRMGALRLETEDGYEICKCGTGFDEEDQKHFWENRNELQGTVVEIEWFELQEVDGEYSLRFPAFVSKRDKAEADTLDRVLEIAE